MEKLYKDFGNQGVRFVSSRLNKLAFLCLLLSAPLSISAQTLSTDSLWAVWIDTEQAPTQRIEALLAYMPIADLIDRPDSLLRLSNAGVEVAEEARIPILLSRSLTYKGKVMLALTQFSESLPVFQRALEEALQTTDSAQIGRCLHNLGSAEYETGKYAEAEEHLLQAQHLQDQIGDSLGLGASLGTTTNLYMDQGRYSESIEVGKRALDLFRHFQDSTQLASTLGNLANPFLYTSQYDSARWYTEQALLIQKALHDETAQAVSYATLGNVAMLQGEMETAISYHELARQRYEAAGKLQGVALCLANIGSIDVQIGNYQEALKLLQEASQIFEEQQNPAYQSTCLMGIGDVYHYQGENEKALLNYQAALELREALGMQYGIAEILGKIGTVYSAQEKVEEALGAYQRSQSIAEKIGDPRRQATSLANIGSLLKTQGKVNEALTYFEKSLDIQDRFDSDLELGTVLLEMARIYREQGRLGEAARTAQRGLSISESIQDLRTQSDFASLLYLTYKESGDVRQALAMNELYYELQDSLNREENQRAIFEFEYQQKALEDSLSNLQRIKDTELEYQQQLSQRNYLIFAALGLLVLGLLGFFYFRNQQRIRIREKELTLQEEQAKQAQLRELDTLKNRFFTNISHEFRTPLTVILGMADQLPAPQDQERSLIRRNGRRLLRLINQLLDLARLESHELRFHWVRGDMVGYLRYLTESFQSLAEERQIELKVETDISELVMDHDAEKIQDIVYNLLSNALKFTPQGGRIGMHISRELSGGAQVLRCTISDTGPGIPTKELPYVFDRFYQGSVAQNESSTGVGLALVKTLLEKMGGNIMVESEIGKGAAFSFTLPIRLEPNIPKAFEEEATMFTPSHREDLPAIEPESYASANPDQQQILIIEDNPDVITYLGAILGPDYHLLTATDGVTGVELAQEHIPDLVITDLMMPGMNGYKVTQALKSDERTSHVPVIMLTAKATQDDRVAGLEFGADAYLTKPFDRAELTVRIEKLLELRQQLQQKYAQGGVSEKGPSPRLHVPTLDELFLQKIDATILSKLGDPALSVYDLCEVVNLARTQVYRKLKALTGKSPTIYIRSFRLEKARQLILETELSISEIAYDMGFNDPGYFTRVFNEHFGQAPSQLRTP